MSDHIRIRKAAGTWVVRADGLVLGQSRDALELLEGSHPPVIYFPPGDLAMALIEPAPGSSVCPWKGLAGYHSVVTQGGVIQNAAWSYAAPKPGVEAIAGHLAFDPDKVTVERL